MTRVLMILALLAFVAVPIAVTAQEPPADKPIEVDKIEQEQIRLLLLDVVVLDKQDRTVPDLTVDDFEIVRRNGDAWPADTLDVDCPGGRAEDARGVRNPAKREAPAAPDASRKLVLALDYMHLGPLERVDVLEQAKDMVKHSEAANEEFMVVALTGGLRIEQPFTKDRKQVIEALDRMEYDISLWNGNFAHLNEFGFVNSLTGLLDVLGTVPGNKAIVFYSMMRDVPLDSQFAEIAGIAAASRCTLYPVDARGLIAPASRSSAPG